MVCASLPGIITGEGVHIHVPRTELYCAKKSRGVVVLVEDLAYLVLWRV